MNLWFRFLMSRTGYLCTFFSRSYFDQDKIEIKSGEKNMDGTKGNLVESFLVQWKYILEGALPWFLPCHIIFHCCCFVCLMRHCNKIWCMKLSNMFACPLQWLTRLKSKNRGNAISYWTVKNLTQLMVFYTLPQWSKI